MSYYRIVKRSGVKVFSITFHLLVVQAIPCLKKGTGKHLLFIGESSAGEERNLLLVTVFI